MIGCLTMKQQGRGAIRMISPNGCLESKEVMRLIAELLHEGYGNRVSREQLMRETGLTERALYQQIHDEREQGVLILSTKSPGGGYYLPGSLEEMKAFYRWARREAISLLHILRPLQREIKKLEDEERNPMGEKPDTDE